MRISLASFNYSVLILGACVKILVFIELVITVDICETCVTGYLSSLDVTWTSLSFQRTLAVERKQKLCMELALGLF